MKAGGILLQLEDLSVARGDSIVISRLTLSIAGPGWFGLVGANGSGKTTLLRAIAGRLPHTSGKIILNGEDFTYDRAARAAHIGFAVEPGMLPGELSPREIFALADPRPDAWNHSALAKMGEALNIASLLDTRCRALSAGNLQRVAIYTAFLGLPRIVILDEPFNWLDPVVTADLKDALRLLIDSEQVQLISALHDLATLTTRCDSSALLAEGRLVREFDQTELRTAQSDPLSFEREIAAYLRSS